MENNPIQISFVDKLDLQDKLAGLPTSPGVYQFKNKEGVIQYVGKAVNLRNRVRQYFHTSRIHEPRIASMVAKISDLEIIATDSEVEALILEANLIKLHKPRYNVNLKDDKSYPYIVITKEPYPRVFVARRFNRKSVKVFGPYTDVNTMRAALKTVRDIFMIRSCNYLINEEFITKKKTRVCLDYHIKKCEGPCEGLVSEERYNEMIDQVAKVLNGKNSAVVERLQEQMKTSASDMKFEEAAKYRDRLKQLEIYSSKQKVVDVDLRDRDIVAVAAEDDDACGVIFKIREGKVISRQHYYMNGVEGKNDSEIIETLVERYYLEALDIPKEVVLSYDIESRTIVEQWLSLKRSGGVSFHIPSHGEVAKLLEMCKKNAKYLLDELKLQKLKQKDFIPAAVRSLQRDLRMEKPPRRIECFDISHFQGTETVASMVVFIDGKPKKSEYRKFTIRTVAPSEVNDFASMKEVIFRRYKRVLDEVQEMPELIMVDGGKGQLSSALESLRELKLENHPIISLAKRLEEVFVPHQSDPLPIPKSSSALRLLEQIRDEAHRFAITFHRSLRDKRTLQTELDLIEGIGKKRSIVLLEVFGSVQGVKFATTEQLSEVVGEKTAQKIREYFVSDDSPAEQNTTQQ
ncbi:MAG TPA: excinuclease ABC subunit C [Bacteroidetes bacterium]|nr:excinuclease ABC subunit C [Bacteroidota bacterium]